MEDLYGNLMRRRFLQAGVGGLGYAALAGLEARKS